jgi:hypothetical protein
MTKIVNIWNGIKQARLEVESEVVSENLVGLDFSTLLYESQPLVELTRISEEFGLYDMEFKKGEW